MKFPRMKFMFQMYKDVFPMVNKKLKQWKNVANGIPNIELRKQALTSIDGKFFHCEGGAVFAWLCKEQREAFISFVVAFQTISDYLDNLCDRSVEQDEKHFRQLHLAMKDALSTKDVQHDYYKYGCNQKDGGYLTQLVKTCQETLARCKGYEKVQKQALELNALYIDLQVYKHLHPSERVEKLQKWAEKEDTFGFSWYEFSAATGSTLGIFMLVAYAMNGDVEKKEMKDLSGMYFHYVQGFHILLDYFIDKDEDEAGGDLNFSRYFSSEMELYDHLFSLYWNVSRRAVQVKDGAFHLMLMHAMLGMYLADPKLQSETFDDVFKEQLLEMGGKDSRFFYRNVKLYRKFRKHV